MFYFLPADMITQILNFGLPAPIDVQVEGADSQANRQFADQLLSQIRQVPGLVDLRIQQPFDQPKLHITVDRTKAEQAGFTQFDIAGGMLVSLSGSFQTTPTFLPESEERRHATTSSRRPRNTASIRCRICRTFRSPRPAARIRRFSATSAPSRAATALAVVNHYNIHRVIDIFGSVEGRDLGAAGNDITRIVDASRKNLPRGSSITIRGQLETMKSSYTGLAAGWRSPSCWSIC